MDGGFFRSASPNFDLSATESTLKSRSTSLAPSTFVNSSTSTSQKIDRMRHLVHLTCSMFEDGNPQRLGG